MQTQMNRVDYDLIVNELLRALDLGREAFTQFRQSPDLYREHYFREFCTVGFIVPRQLGKSSFLIDWVQREESSLLVVRGSNIRDFLICNYEHHYGRDVVCRDRVVTLQELKQLIENDALPEYKTLLIDEAMYCFHFVEKMLHQYLFDKKRWQTTIVRVG